MTITPDNTRCYHGKTAYTLVAHADDGPFMGVCEVITNCKFRRLSSLYVHPDYRHQGVAKTMVDQVCQQSDKSGLPLYVESDAFEMPEDTPSGMGDEQLRQFYFAHDFIPVLGHPFALVRYPKKLQG